MNAPSDYETARREYRREALKLSIAAIVLVGLLCYGLMGCASVQLPAKPDPAQVAQIAAVAQSVAGIGAQGVLLKNPGARPQLIAVAEAIEQACAMPNAPEPQYLTQVVAQAAAQFGGPYGTLAALAIQGGLAFYQNFYAANTSSALDKQPAFKAVLTGLAKGLREGVGVPAAGPVIDLVLRPAK